LGRGKMDRPLTRKDCQTDSPFNTYLHNGLPPAPICCPGESSIRALFCAPPSEELFFVVSPEGGEHSFSNNFLEHSRKARARASVQRREARSNVQGKARGDVRRGPRHGPQRRIRPVRSNVWDSVRRGTR
jgi:hypothetical protein